jgi:hypothetical protein
VTHAAVRLDLLRGQFQYRETGLLDRTHLHFYDAREVDRLFQEAGLTITSLQRTVQSASGTEIPLDLGSFSSAVLAEILSDAEALTYQYVVTASPTNNLWVTSAALSSLSEVTGGERSTLFQNLYAAQEERVREVQAELNAERMDRQRAQEELGRLRYRAADLLANALLRGTRAGPLVTWLVRPFAGRIRDYLARHSGENSVPTKWNEKPCRVR